MASAGSSLTSGLPLEVSNGFLNSSIALSSQSLDGGVVELAGRE